MSRPDIRAVDLNGVCWGYREQFRAAISRLYDYGYLGDKRPRVTDLFWEVMGCADQSQFDHVLKEFLEAFGERTAWILDIPGMFEEVVKTGCELADDKLVYGIHFFRQFGAGSLGETPEEIRQFLSLISRLRMIDGELAYALLKGYGQIRRRLVGREIDRFVDMGLHAHRRNRRTGIHFLECTLAASEETFRELTKEVRLSDVKAAMERLIRALSGRGVHVDSLDSADSDQLIERRSECLAFPGQVNVPGRIRRYGRKEDNKDRYYLYAVVVAGAYACNSFPLVHGTRGIASITAVTGPDPDLEELVSGLEYARILAFCRARWPGARRLINAALDEAGPHGMNPERLIGGSAEDTSAAGTAAFRAAASRIVRDAGSVWEVIELSKKLVESYGGRLPAFVRELFAGPGFLPDFGYAVDAGAQPADLLTADLKRTDPERRSEPDGSEEDDESPAVVVPSSRSEQSGRDRDPDDERTKQPPSGVRAAYIYDEWDIHEGLYHRDHCRVYEQNTPRVSDLRASDLDIPDPGNIGRAFELLRPVEAAKVKRLADGDEINHDLLIDYLTKRRHDPAPKVEFYERRFIDRRDLSVLLLLDVSGSTAESDGKSQVLDAEKQAAILLAHGLSSLDDRFSICGFSGNGREDCRFFVYKDFDDRWDTSQAARLLAATAQSATRIGAALRHAGYRLSVEPHRQRLIILITDGRPTDRDYDPETRYAQSDVRMACEENLHAGVQTFGISTLENSRADMEIMFPKRRFVILRDMRDLPSVLPRLYVRLTV